MNATVSAQRQLLVPRHFQFSLADAVCWTTYIAVAACLWNVAPFFTFLMIFWGVPAWIRQRAYCRQMPECDLLSRGVLLFASFVLEGILSTLACVFSTAITIFALMVAMTVVKAFEVHISGDYTGLVLLFMVWTFFAVYVVSYEILRRYTWPK